MDYTFAKDGSPLSALTLSNLGTDFETSLTHEESDGVFVVKLVLTSQSPKCPPPLKISWRMIPVNTLCQWRPDKDTHHHIDPKGLDKGLKSQATQHAPVICLHDIEGTNRLTCAVNDCLHPVVMKAGVDEHSAEILCQAKPFEGTRLPRTHFEVLLYLDTRNHPFYETLAEVSEWWASMEGYTPIPVPETGRLPMYSTWYSYHQKLTSAEIENECRLAKEIGCESVIVDDGWQTIDANGGYAFTGDWQAERLTDIKESVQRIHELDMKYLLWYSVPFVGYQSSTYETFKDKFLYRMDGLKCGVLDPRYPEVRAYLIDTYVQALKEWNLDGFKLDFVERFSVPATGTESTAPHRDYDCVYEGADRLLCDVIDTLREIKPDILIEFRQPYNGPIMRRYGNLIRAGDCAMDAITNRVRTLDIKLLAGTTATHADMLMWHKDDSPENAARQFLNILFSVPQISVRLADLSDSHKEMLKHYMAFWFENREVLLDGDFMPQHPEALYTSVWVKDTHKTIVALYSTHLVELPDSQPPTMHMVNATGSRKITFSNLASYTGVASIFDCMGVVQETLTLTGSDAATYAIPVSGRMELVKSRIPR